MLSRALNLRRLSYVIYSGKKNHFLPQLPSIQEKLVDILRTNVAELVHSEVSDPTPFPVKLSATMC